MFLYILPLIIIRSTDPTYEEKNNLTIVPSYVYLNSRHLYLRVDGGWLVGGRKGEVVHDGIMGWNSMDMN